MLGHEDVKTRASTSIPRCSSCTTRRFGTGGQRCTTLPTRPPRSLRPLCNRINRSPLAWWWI